MLYFVMVLFIYYTMREQQQNSFCTLNIFKGLNTMFNRFIITLFAVFPSLVSAQALSTGSIIDSVGAVYEKINRFEANALVVKSTG